MESDSRLGSILSKTGDWLNEQEWFQELKGKWDSLDPQSQFYLKVGAMLAPVFVLLLFVLSMMWSVHSLKKELNDKNDLLQSIEGASAEMRRLKDAASTTTFRGGVPGGPWPAYFETVAGAAGLGKESFAVSPEKPGASTDLAKEALYSMTLKHVNIKQVTRLAFGLENGARPVKLRSLTIDTKNDPSGYVDATLAVSAFTLQAK